VVSLPKLKVHRKVGTTLNLKNMVGVNADKNHLAHYRVGAPADGGDEFSAPRWDDRVERTLTDRLLGRHWRAGRYPFVAWKIVRKVYRLVAPVRDPGSFSYGNWHRNDTAWRMALDLNNVVFFGSRNGRVERAQQRRYLSLVDGVVGGDGEGPLHPDAVPAGVVVAGFNPVAVDWVATHLMGFRPEAFRLYENGARQMAEWVPFDVGRIAVRSNVQEWETMLERDETIFRFAPSAGWKGSIERYDATPADPLVSADVDPLAQ
jgi:hypothetical protein